MAFGYALVGGFQRAIQAWRDVMQRAGQAFFDVNDELLGRVGRAAVDDEPLEDDLEPLPDARDVRACMRLVNRALLLWLVFVATLVLIGWVR